MTVPAGTAAEIEVNFKKNKDDQGEVVYELQYPNAADPSPRFQLKVHRGRRWKGYTYDIGQPDAPLGNMIDPPTRKFDLKFQEDASVPLILAKNPDDWYFTSSNTPVDFLSHYLPQWGNRTLRDLSLPATHNSGMGIITHRHNMAGEGGTQTQSRIVRDQLELGARHLDIRPKLVHEGRMYKHIMQKEDWAVTGHYSHIDVSDLELATNFEWFGADGESVWDVILNINAFTKKNNELLILDLSHALDRKYKDFNQEDWDRLLRVFLHVKHRYIAPEGVTDLSILTLNDFIGGEKPHPAVIILVEGPWDQGFNLRPEFAGHGFYPGSALPKAGSYSNTNDLGHLLNDQFAKMSAGNPNGIFELHWYMTQQWQDAFRATIMERLRGGTHKLIPVSWENSLLEFGDDSNRGLWRELWPRLMEDGAGFPNLITMDNIRDAGVRNLAVAINNRFRPRGGK